VVPNAAGEGCSEEKKKSSKKRIDARSGRDSEGKAKPAPAKPKVGGQKGMSKACSISCAGADVEERRSPGKERTEVTAKNEQRVKGTQTKAREHRR